MFRKIWLSDKLIKNAEAESKKYSRTPSQQIEKWAYLGKIAEENPELRFEFIQKILEGLEHSKTRKVSKYEL